MIFNPAFTYPNSLKMKELSASVIDLAHHLTVIAMAVLVAVEVVMVHQDAVILLLVIERNIVEMIIGIDPPLGTITTVMMAHLAMIAPPGVVLEALLLKKGIHHQGLDTKIHTELHHLEAPHLEATLMIHTITDMDTVDTEAMEVEADLPMTDHMARPMHR
jgi:hypothetical protein